MRSISLVSTAAVVLVLSMGLFAEEEAPKSTHERIRAEVLKVFSAKDGNANFRAYLIKWKDQEVIASDQLAKSNYQVGDTITVLAMNHRFPSKKVGPRLLHFQVLQELPVPLEETPAPLVP